MAERAYESSEAWSTSLRLTGAVGRLRIMSNLKAVTEAHDRAFAEAGRAVALLAEGSTHEVVAQVAAYRDARGALAQCEAWLHVIAELTNEPISVFDQELEMADLAQRQIGASIRVLETGRGSGRDVRDAGRTIGSTVTRAATSRTGPTGSGAIQRGGTVQRGGTTLPGGSILPGPNTGRTGRGNT